MTRRTTIAFTTLCLLAGSTWIADAALPAAFPGSFALFANSAILALVFYFAGRRRLPPATPRTLTYLALLLPIPVALASLSDGHLSSTTIVLIYALVPVATVFVAAQSSQADLLSFLGPALAGIAGAALILPFAMPSSLAGALWMAAIILSAIAAAFSGIRLHKLLEGQPILPSAALAAAASALVGLALDKYQSPTVVLLTWPQALLSASVHLGLAAATLLLTIGLLRDLDPIAFSARFFLIPLVTIVEGYLLLHPTAGWTLPAGLLLLAGGSFILIRTRIKPDSVPISHTLFR